MRKNEKKDICLSIAKCYMRRQEVPDWENPIVVGINKEPYHATLTLPSQKVDCKEIISLNASGDSNGLPTGKAPGRLLQE